MQLSLVNRREQMVSDGLMLTYDQDHWNSVHPTEEPIQLPMDLTLTLSCGKIRPTKKRKRLRSHPYSNGTQQPYEQFRNAALDLWASCFK